MGAKNEVTYALNLESQKFNGQIAQVEGKVTKAGQALGGATKGAKGFGDAIAGAEPAIGKGATAISGLAGVIGPLGGETNAAAGAIANLAGAFTLGPAGGLVAVAGAAVLALGALVTSKIKAREEAKKLEEALRTELNASFEALEQRVQDSRTALINFGKTSTEIRASQAEASIVRLQGELDAAEQQRDLIEEGLPELKKASEEASAALFAGAASKSEREFERLMKNAAEAKEQYQAAAREAKNLGTTIQNLEVEQRKEQEVLENTIELLNKEHKATAKTTTAKKTRAKATKEAVKIEVEEQDKRVRVSKEAFDAIQEIERQRLVHLGVIKLEEEKVTEKKKEEKKKQVQVTKEAAREMTEIESTALNLALSGFQQVADVGLQTIEQLAAGEKVRAEVVAASVLKTAGTQVIGAGLGLFSTGVAKAVASEGVLGQKEMAAGVALVGVGGVMGGVGAGFLGALKGAQGGGTAPREIGSFARAELGEGSGAGNARTEEGGPTVTNITYNAPIFGDPGTAANSVAEHQRLAARELLAKV